ncbi:MAG: UDP-N-acetylmuramoyl-tripeptide--D-alanyl-D-alanine ligase [Actinobacteria bacterium]|nr:UDP-N-acetylmuramoyl-tripeptide--D-alanyl-D-alanine ligase [Actinomycetota bacterium]MCB9388953.1 UDP-N-acetylmuramoyl-tripeptide--D-alanyl-D-alanine ligase [Acidimicrobiia bacterium]
MMFDLEFLAEALSGTIRIDAKGLGPQPDRRLVDGADVDTRRLRPGQGFVALKSARDGHDFVRQAWERGASVCVVDRGSALTGGPLLEVDDTAAVLGRWAHLARAEVRSVIGVTGSAGKTSTKDLLAAALAEGGSVVASEGSFNNEIGLPLTLINAPRAVEVVVAEMGARKIGDIAYLADVAEPSIGIITNIGYAHIGEFGDQATIAMAKGELFEALPSGGTAIAPSGSPFLDEWRTRTNARFVTFGEDPGAEVRATDITVQADMSTKCRVTTPWGVGDLYVPLIGRHQVSNALAALSAAMVLGRSLDDVLYGISEAAASRWRMEMSQTASGATIINDAYNANPESVRAALETLADMPVTGRRILVLGEIAEMGDLAHRVHSLVADQARAAGVDLLVAVGDGVSAAVERGRKLDLDVMTFASPVDAGKALAGELRCGDAVLVKASRASGLERAVATILTEGSGS